MSPDWISPHAAAKLWGLSPSLLSDYIHGCELPAINIAPRWPIATVLPHQARGSGYLLASRRTKPRQPHDADQDKQPAQQNESR